MSRFAKILRIRKTQLALAVLLVVGLSLIPVHGTHAGSIWDIATGATSGVSGVITTVLNAFLYLIGKVLGVGLAAIATMADSVMQPVAITTNTTLQMAWGITRDFANMFFILILLGIALDFILFNSFKVKQMIPRLILVALLINFSLPIAGVLIDFANVFTQFFLSQTTGAATGSSGFSATIANKLSLATLFTNEKQGFLDALKMQDAVFLNMVFIILFMAGTAFVFLVLALMFLVRTGYLYVLLATLPLVLVLSAFPPTAGHFKSWTNSFIKWTMFAPIATFFLWFAMIMADQLLKNSSNITAFEDFNLGGSFYKYIIIWIFLLGALTAAQGMGGKAAGMAMGAAGWAKGKTINGLKQGGKRAWRETGGRAAGALSEKVDKGGMFGGFAARQLKSIEVASKTGIEAKQIAKLEDKYKGYSKEEMTQEIQRLQKNPLNEALVLRLQAMQARKGGMGYMVARNTGETDADYHTRNQDALLKAYDNSFTSEATRRQIEKASPELALHVFDQNSPRNINRTPQQKIDLAQKYDIYLKSLRSDDISKMGTASINQKLINEMVRTDSWGDYTFRAMYDNAGAGFVTAFNGFTGAAGIKDTFPAQQFDKNAKGEPSGPWYPANATDKADAETKAFAVMDGATSPADALVRWRRLVGYANSPAVLSLGITPLASIK